MWLLYLLLSLVGLLLLIMLSVFIQNYVPKKIEERNIRKTEKLIIKRLQEANFSGISYNFAKYDTLKYHDPSEHEEIRFRCVPFPSSPYFPLEDIRQPKKPDINNLKETKTSEEVIEEPKEEKRPKPNRDWLEKYVNKVESCITNTKEVDVSGFPELEARLRAVIDELLAEGVPLHMIQNFLNGIVNLSSITITKQYKIILNDYGNMEIKMGPLPKTVFFFYLRHPEGISFTYLQDYRDEFINIYSHITNFDDRQKIEDSIDRLINPLDNSISEKCSAVKTAFTNILDNQIARYYYIWGSQGEKKFIHIKRNLVKWETEF